MKKIFLLIATIIPSAAMEVFHFGHEHTRFCLTFIDNIFELNIKEQNYFNKKVLGNSTI